MEGTASKLFLVLTVFVPVNNCICNHSFLFHVNGANMSLKDA